jgi:lambda repressor-like predicted transcriptional regulator
MGQVSRHLPRKGTTVTVTGVSGLSSLYALQKSSSIDTTQRASRSDGPAGPPPAGGSGKTPGHIEVAAEALGLSTDDVVEALEGGSSLAELAEQQGVSRDDLVAALVAGAPSEIAASGDVEEMVGNLVDQVGMGGPGGGRPPQGSTGVLGETLTSDQQTTLDLLTSLLDTSSSSLVSSLRSGTSLASLLSGAGVSYDALAGAVESVLLIDTSA